MVALYTSISSIRVVVIKRYVSYFVPKSQAHYVSIRKRKQRAALQLVRDWLTENTVFRFEERTTFSLVVSVGDKIFSQKISEINRNQFGEPTIIGTIQDWQTEVVAAEIWEYTLSFDALEALFDHVESNITYFTNSGYTIGVAVDFIVLDLDGKPFPNQAFDGPDSFHSSYSLALNQSSMLSPDLNFPFPYNNLFQSFWKSFSSKLPFKPNNNHLRELVLLEDRLEYKTVKLPFQ